LASSPGAAQPRAPGTQDSSAAAPVDLGGAKADFANAQKLFKAGKFAEALPLFRSVADSTKSPNARLYVGHCLEQLGKVVEAYKVFELIAKEITEHPEDKYEPTREAAMVHVGLLNVRVSKVVISLTDMPPDVVVTLDGIRIEERELGSPVVVTPGSHHVEAAASGVTPARRDVNLDGGEMKTVILSLKNLDDARPAAAAPAPPEPKPDVGSGGSMRTAAYVAGGVGVVGLGIFAVTGLMAKSTFDKLDGECKGGCSDAAHLSDIDRGKSLQTAANVGLVLGVVGVGTGVTLFLLGGKGSDGPSVSLTRGGGTLSYAGRF
jgi:hypothetical protein